MFANEFCIPGMKVLNLGTDNYNPILEFITSEPIVTIADKQGKYVDLTFNDPDCIPLESDSFDIILDLESIPVSSNELKRILNPK